MSNGRSTVPVTSYHLPLLFISCSWSSLRQLSVNLKRVTRLQKLTSGLSSSTNCWGTSMELKQTERHPWLGNAAPSPSDSGWVLPKKGTKQFVDGLGGTPGFQSPKRKFFCGQEHCAIWSTSAELCQTSLVPAQFHSPQTTTAKCSPGENVRGPLRRFRKGGTGRCESWWAR